VSIPNYDTYGATSLFSTVGDLLKWEANFETPVVGDAALLAEMQRSGVLTNGDTTNYALGLQAGRHRGELQVGHGGADAGYRAYVWRFPSKGLAGAVLCNFASADANAFFQQVSDAYLGAPATAAAPNAAPPAGVALSAEEIERRAGVYHNPVTDAVVFLRAENGRLLPGRTGGAAFIPLDASRFRNATGAVEYTFSPDGRTVSVRPVGSSAQPQRLERHAPARPTPQALRAYAGSYVSDELGGATYRVTATDSTLELRTRTSEPGVVRPAFGDTFDAGNRVVRFTRDSRGRVTGFTLSDGRMRRVAFRRV
jgi:YD repeat-containing protein